MRNYWITSLSVVLISICLMTACGKKNTEEPAMPTEYNQADESVPFSEGGGSQPADDIELLPEEPPTEIPASMEESDVTGIEELPHSVHPGTLSGDIYSFSVLFDDNLYTFPMRYSDFVSFGWEYRYDDSQVLDSGVIMDKENFLTPSYEINASLYNCSTESTAYRNSAIGGIYVNRHLTTTYDGEIILPGHIKCGEATIADVEEAYGAPTESGSDEFYITYTYEKDTNSRVILFFSPETNQLLGFDLKNIVATDSLIANSDLLPPQVTDEPNAD